MGLEKIAYYKKQKGFTNKDLADAANLPISTVEKIVSGRTKDPKLITLKSIADALGCTLDDFNDNITTSPFKADDLDLRKIERARNNMSDKDKNKMMKVLAASFEEYFSDDYVDDDIDE